MSSPLSVGLCISRKFLEGEKERRDFTRDLQTLSSSTVRPVKTKSFRYASNQRSGVVECVVFFLYFQVLFSEGSREWQLSP